MKLSTISITFKSHSVLTLKRSASYTNTDFLAVCGGLLGLFLGVSALSIIEFIYHLMVRLYWTIHLWKLRHAVVAFKPKICNKISVSKARATNKRDKATSTSDVPFFIVKAPNYRKWNSSFHWEQTFRLKSKWIRGTPTLYWILPKSIYFLESRKGGKTILFAVK